MKMESGKELISPVESIEIPYFISSDSLARQIDRALLFDPRRVVPVIVRAMQDGRIKVSAEKVRSQKLGRRRLLKVIGGGGLRLKAQFQEDQVALEEEIYTNEKPFPFAYYYPLRTIEAHKLGQVTLDEIGGPLDVYDTAQYLLTGRVTDVRGWWQENVTEKLVSFIYERAGFDPRVLQSVFSVAGYCPGLAATQIRKGEPSHRLWFPDIENSSDYSVADYHIVGMYDALFSGGVAHRPIETYQKSLSGPTDEVRQNVQYFMERFRSMPPGSDRLFVIEWPQNWFRAVLEVDSDDIITAENFNNPRQRYIRVAAEKVLWAHIPYSFSQAIRLIKTGQLLIPARMMSELSLFRAPELDEEFIDLLANRQRFYS